MGKKLCFFIGVVCLVLLFTASSSYANAGIPIVTVQLPFMLSLLVPVVLIEAILLRQALALHWFTATLISFKANLISTILGCPIAWVLQFFVSIPVAIGIENFFAGNEHAERLSDFLGMMVGVLPISGLEVELFWLLPLGGLVGLLPAYFVSVWFEYPFIRKQADEQGIHPKRLMYRVNIFSYALLLGVWCLQLYFNLLQGEEVALLPFGL